MKKKPPQNQRISTLEMLQQLSPEGRARVKREVEALVRQMSLKVVQGGKSNKAPSL